MADAPADYMTEMLAGIVAFRIEVRRVIAKSKLSQNREARDYRGVVDGLERSGNLALAGCMSGRAERGQAEEKSSASDKGVTAPE